MTALTPNHYKMKWWGWGDPQKHYDLDAHPGVLKLLQNKLGLKQINPRPTFRIDEQRIPETQLPKEVLNKFVSLLGAEVCSTSKTDRYIHAFGKSYKDLIRIRQHQFDTLPDLVLYPKNQQHIADILSLCRKHRIALIPFGGGTSVVGGLEPLRGQMPYLATLNMTVMNQVLNLDLMSQVVTVQAGILGPDLENRLHQEGFQLGHYPQSFEFSTVGGWIAARSSGQNSILYGGIEKLLVSVAVLTPQGEFKTLTCPRSAEGPNLNEFILGSEGTCGIIVSATLRITPIPEHKRYYMLAFKSFKESTEASRLLIQSGLRVAMLRVSDETETEAFLTMNSSDKKGLANLKSKLAKKYLSLKKLYPPNMSLMLIGLEGTQQANIIKRKTIQKLFSSFKTISLGESPGKKWLEQRFFLPYLRDELLDNHILIDTLETATTWSNLENLYLSLKDSLQSSCDTTVGRGLVLTHISHLYSDGASLYFTIIAPQQQGKELTQWTSLKEAANITILKHGGTISHHHGVGIDHKNHLTKDQQSKKIVRDIKHSIDPDGILNPGKLI